MGVDEGTACLMAGQKKLKNEYKDPDVLTKVNKSDMARMMEDIKEYLTSCCGDVQATLVYVIRKTITVQTYGNYPTYATPDDEMITRMLHLPPEKNKLHVINVQTVGACMPEYKIDNKTVYDILDQICKDTDCIHMSSSTSRRGMAEGHFMPSIPDG